MSHERNVRNVYSLPPYEEDHRQYYYSGNHQERNHTPPITIDISSKLENILQCIQLNMTKINDISGKLENIEEIVEKLVQLQTNVIEIQQKNRRIKL